MKLPLLAALALAATAQTQDATGWSAAKWGMTLQLASEAFPGSRLVSPPTRDSGLLVRLKSGPVQLGAFPATAEFEFQPGSDYLSVVTVSLDESVPRTSAYESLKHSLTEKYGKPTTEDTTNERNTFGSHLTTRNVQWRLKSSMVLLTWMEDRDIGYIGVRYSERKPDPTL